MPDIDRCRCKSPSDRAEVGLQTMHDATAAALAERPDHVTSSCPLSTPKARTSQIRQQKSRRNDLVGPHTGLLEAPRHRASPQVDAGHPRTRRTVAAWLAGCSFCRDMCAPRACRRGATKAASLDGHVFSTISRRLDGVSWPLASPEATAAATLGTALHEVTQ
jgi:hypothetical protein